MRVLGIIPQTIREKDRRMGCLIEKQIRITYRMKRRVFQLTSKVPYIITNLRGGGR